MQIKDAHKLASSFEDKEDADIKDQEERERLMSPLSPGYLYVFETTKPIRVEVLTKLEDNPKEVEKCDEKVCLHPQGAYRARSSDRGPILFNPELSTELVRTAVREGVHSQR